MAYIPTSSPAYTPAPKSGGGITGAIGTASTAMGIINSIVPAEVINNTIGAALKHGFKCWGASVNPDKATVNLNAWVPPLVDRAEFAVRASDKDLETRINDWFVLWYNTGTKHRWWYDNGARDCTRDSIELELDALNNVKADVMSAFEEEVSSRGHVLQSVGTKTINIPPNKSWDQPATTWQVEQFKVILTEKSPLESVADVVTGGSGSILPVLAVAGVVMWKGGFFKSLKSMFR